MRNKVIKNKKIILITLSFLIPLITYLTVFYINGLLTEKTILSGDMYAQYYPLFNYLKGVFEGTNSIFYSFSKGLGGTMFGTIFYYLSSPLNLLLILVDKQHIPDFMTYLVILKLSLCGLTMYLYMRRKYKTDNLLLLTFSVCYSFMGYNLNYFINIMWLDVVFMAPLVLIGLDKIIEDKSPTFYIITLFISIFSNYYIAYMLCIYCVLYFIYEILIKYNMKEDKIIIKKLTKKFIISSLLTGGLCSFFLVPCFFEMLTYGRGVELKEIFTFDYNFFNLFSKSYIGSLDLNDVRNYISLNIYTGTICPILLYTYLINKNIEKKQRILLLITLLLMLLPCFLGPLNYIWHLSIPNGYNYRYSFLLCILILNISYKTFYKINITKLLIPYLIIYIIITIYLIIIINLGNSYSFLKNINILITQLFIIIYIILLKTSKSKKINYIIMIFIVIEQLINITIIFKTNTYENRKILNEQNVFNDKIEKYINDNRIELEQEPYTMNDSLIKSYKGINNFLSTSNYKTMIFLLKAGKNRTNDNNMYIIEFQSEITNAILNLKTKLTENESSDIIYNTVDNIKATDDVNLKVLENKNPLSIGYIIKNECNNLEYEFPYDEKIFNCMINKDDKYYKEYKKEESNTYIIKNKGYYYLYLEDIDLVYEDILDTDVQENIVYLAYNYLILKNDKNNYNLNIKNESGIDIDNLKVYQFCDRCFTENLKELTKERLNYSIENNKLKGTISTEGGILMITLPYENGFTIKVNNKKIKYKEVIDTFIGIDLEKGKYEIELEYNQPFLKEGILISSISLILSVIFIIKEKEKNEK